MEMLSLQFLYCALPAKDSSRRKYAQHGNSWTKNLKYQTFLSTI